MKKLNNIYFYKVTADSGGAPCVYHGVLSLAICKPKIRRKAEVGDLLFGFGGESLGGRLIYAAYVTKKPKVGDYYRKRKYRGRPDRIYRSVRGRAKLRADAQFHTDGKELNKDVGRHFKKAHVLLSTNFRYLGAAGTTDYLQCYPHLAKVLESLTQGHRVDHKQCVRDELRRLAKKLWKDFPRKRSGNPSDGEHSQCCNN